MFKHGDKVRDARTGHEGTVHVFELSDEDRAEGCAKAEVRWKGSFVSDELEVAIHNGLTQA